MSRGSLFDATSAMCCRNFTLPFSPEELKVRYCEWLDAFNKGKPYYPLKDIHLVYPMLIYKGKFKAETTGEDSAIEQYHYTCKHLDRHTGTCSIYDIRPDVCKTYPNYKCSYEGCATHSICNGIKMVKEREQEKPEMKYGGLDKKVACEEEYKMKEECCEVEVRGVEGIIP